MNTIWKFTLDITDRQTVMVPPEYSVLAVDVQNGRACLWAKVQPAPVRIPIAIAIVGTGNPMPDEPTNYLGTIQMPPFVWHVFLLDK